MPRAWCIRALVCGLCLSPGLASGQTSDGSGWFAAAPGGAPAGQGDTLSVDPDASDTDPRALSEFRPILDKYGDWVEDARYGLVWVPARRWVGDDFAPYLTRGRWALDTAGDWVWVSDYAFGRVVFHYGRWVWVVGLGWAWVPGYRYAPAWVHWRVPMHDGLYVGWAPAPPSYVWVSGVAVGVGFYVTTPWVFCHSHYVFSPHVHGHRVDDPSRMKEAARQTKPYHPQIGARGPSPASLGVPTSRLPTSRLPAQPRPANSVDTRSRSSAPESAGWWRDMGGPVEPSIDSRAARVPQPSISASERVGARTLPTPTPAPRTPSGTTARVPASYSIAPRATRQPVGMAPWSSSLGRQGTGYVRGSTPSSTPQTRAVLPRSTVVPHSVASPRRAVPVAPAPVRTR